MVNLPSMLCGALVTLALNATLLGDQSLKLESSREIQQSECSSQNETANPNAVLSLKDAKGNTVFSQKIRVAQVDFYLNGQQRGGLPARDAVVFVNYPRTSETARATKVELKMISFPFDQSARLPANRAAKTNVKLAALK